MKFYKEESKIKVFLNIIAEWERLVEDGVLGFYQRCEVTEIVGFRKEDNLPFNVLSMVVVEEGQPAQEKRLINKERIILPRLNGYFFGVYQYHTNIQAIKNALHQYVKENVWQLSESPLSVGDLYPVPIFFAPPEGTESTPLNGILKNNFWNGSHIFELFDNKKESFKRFLDNPPLLQILSEKIQEYIPVCISKLSDRIGNILIQIPVTKVMCDFFFNKDYSVAAKIALHPANVGDEKLYNLTTQSIHDGLVVSGFVE